MRLRRVFVAAILVVSCTVEQAEPLAGMPERHETLPVAAGYESTTTLAQSTTTVDTEALQAFYEAVAWHSTTTTTTTAVPSSDFVASSEVEKSIQNPGEADARESPRIDFDPEGDVRVGLGVDERETAP